MDYSPDEWIFPMKNIFRQRNIAGEWFKANATLIIHGIQLNISIHDSAWKWIQMSHTNINLKSHHIKSHMKIQLKGIGILINLNLNEMDQLEQNNNNRVNANIIQIFWSAFSIWSSGETTASFDIVQKHVFKWN